MKNSILFLAIAITLMSSVIACQSPEDLMPPVSRNGINSITASFPNDNRDGNSFSSEIDYDSRTITIVVPYNYPENSTNVVTIADLANMRVKANLDDNVTVQPSLLYMDLTKENRITVIDQVKNRIEYTIVAEIRKSNLCAITKYDLPSHNLSGVINDASKVVSLISLESIGSVLADVSVSHGATIAPDPTVTAQNYDADFTVTVTAQNGVDNATYTIRKSVPSKVSVGLRAGSRKLLWAKKLTDLGIPQDHMTTGISALKDYLVLNTRGQNSLYLNAKTGEIVGSINISSISGSLKNFYGTADEGNNILICNLTANDGNTFKIYRVSGVAGTPQLYISWDAAGLPLGRKISVRGSLDGNAIITAPVLNANLQFARWQVTGGTLVSQTPDIVTVSGIAYSTNVDVVYSKANDPNSDFFFAYYGAPYQFTWFNGATKAPKLQGSVISSNWIVNAVDYIDFNNSSFVLHNSVNSFNWGMDDNIYLYDVSTVSFDNSTFVCDPGTYGAKELGGVVNANGTGDVAFKASDNGYYLYVYFMFTNGYVVCVQYDCIEM
jgi:hypothetical protein